MAQVNEQEISGIAAVVAICVADHDEIAAEVSRIAPDVDVRVPGHMGDPTEIDAIVCWKPQPGLLSSLTKLQLIQSTGAGVDGIVGDPHRNPWTPIARTIDRDIAVGMTAYVRWAVVDHFKGMDRFRADRVHQRWNQFVAPSPERHAVGFAGVGELGLACLRDLASAGFATRCWSRQPKVGLPESTKRFAGDSELAEFLRGCNSLVCLLPLTPSTKGFLGKSVFDLLPEGAHVINVARGEHLVEPDLLAAFDSGQVSRATLDVFAQEPLPAGHPFWTRPEITITPHIAARASARSIAEQLLANLAAVRAGKVPQHCVDARAGY